MKELHARRTQPEGRLRRPGGGRKQAVEEDPSLLVDLEKLLEPVTPGASGVPAAVDLQERPQAGRGVAASGASHQLPFRSPPTGSPGLQPAGQP
jgi:hypothetical protein